MAIVAEEAKNYIDEQPEEVDCKIIWKFDTNSRIP